jgi:hypothetical protein
LTACGSAAASPAPVEVPVPTLLIEAREAAGGSAWDQAKALHLQAKLAVDDKPADAEEWCDLVAGRFAMAISDGPEAGHAGYDGKAAWAADLDGEVRVAAGAARADLVTDAYIAGFGWWRPDRLHAAIVWARAEKLSGRLYDVLQVTPTGGDGFELWLDHSTHLPGRLIVDRSTGKETMRLSGWRRVQQLGLPSRIEVEIPAEHRHWIETVTDTDINPPIDASRYAPPTRLPADYVFAGEAVTARVPFRMLNGHIYVEARSEKMPLLLMFDTSSPTVLDQAAWNRLGLAARPDSPPGTPARLPMLELGGITFRHPAVLLRDLAGLGAVEGVPVDGIIGYELARRLVIEIDYDSRRLVLLAPDGFVAPPLANSLAIRLVDRLPTIPGRIDGIPASLAIDTGRSLGLIVNPAFAEAHGLIQKWHPRDGVVFGWGADGTVPGALARAASLELGVQGVAQPLAILPPDRSLAADAALGNAVLQHFDLILDYRHNTLWLQPGGRTDQPEGLDHAGLWLRRDAGGPIVAAVVPFGPAAHAGLREGDAVETIGSDKAGKIGLSAMRDRLAGPPGTAVTLGVRRDGDFHAFRILLADPLAAPADGG